MAELGSGLRQFGPSGPKKYATPTRDVGVLVVRLCGRKIPIENRQELKLNKFQRLHPFPIYHAQKIQARFQSPDLNILTHPFPGQDQFSQ